MKNLLKKEFTLTASSLAYIFIAFTLMVFIPQYPILVGAFFVCFGVFQSFQKAREANDILFSTLLPVKKTDIVKVKYLFAVCIQCAALLLMCVFVVIRLLALNKVAPYSINTLMNANLCYLGFVLIVFSWFNIFFVGGFFKTAYKIGIPFLTFGIATLLTVVVGEALHFIPGLGVLNDGFHFSHLIVLGVGLVLYVAGTIISLITSQRRFERIDI